MKYRHYFGALLIYVSLLAGCLNPSQQVAETQPVSILTASTSTPTSTVTVSVTSTLTTVTPTREVSPTPPPLPTLPPHKNASSYQLMKPTPEGLLALMDVLNTQYGYFGHFYDDKGNLMFDPMLDELSNVLHVTATETNFYYPEGFPDPQIVWEYYPFTNRDHYPVFPLVYLEGLTSAVFDDFNRHPDQLKNRGELDGKEYTVQTYRIELDNDPKPEWLVRMDWEEIAALSWLVLDQNPDGNYTRLPQSLPDSDWLILSDVEIETLQDFTGDGLTDIIALKQGYAAGTDWYRFYVAQGTNKGFQELDSIDHAVSVTNSSVEPHYIIETPLGSNWLTLTSVDPHRINWDCGWDTQKVYRWPYGNEQIVVSGKEVPRTPECSLARAVSLLDPVDNITAIQLLENAIGHFDQQDAKQRGKIMFAHYRLAILYAVLDQDTLSRQHMKWVIEHSTESEQYLKDNLSPLLKEKKISAIKLCDSMFSAGAEMPDEWEKYLGATVAAHAYPGSTEIYPPAICPLQDIILDQLRKVDLTKQPISEKALADQMIPVALHQRYPFPNQSRPASFMLIREKTPYIAGYVPTRDGWKWEVLEEFDAMEEPPQTFSRDVTGDGFPELAYFQKYKYWYCPENKEGYEVLLITSIGSGLVSVTHNFCHPMNQALSLADYLPDENRDGIVDWVADEIRRYAGGSAFTAERAGPVIWFTLDEISTLFPKENFSDETADPIDELTDKLYDDRNVSTIRQRLMIARDNLNSTDPVFDGEWQRLTYLIAVSYEIQGQNDKAIEEFTSILQSENQTLWGNLAALHLTSK